MNARAPEAAEADGSTNVVHVRLDPAASREPALPVLAAEGTVKGPLISSGTGQVDWLAATATVLIIVSEPDPDWTVA